MSPWLQALPITLGALKKLSTFIADENLLTTLPEEVRWLSVSLVRLKGGLGSI